jgi:hypothetical protein
MKAKDKDKAASVPALRDSHLSACSELMFTNQLNQDEGTRG